MINESNEIKHPRDSWARVNTQTKTYFDIALQEAAQGIECRLKAKASTDQFEISEFSSLAYQHSLKAIVFSSMCVEAGINDYAGIQLGDKYCEKHIYSMDVISKWVLVPKLVCGNEMDKSGPAFRALQQLVKSRNKLVHSKSRDIGVPSLELAKRLKKADLDFEEDFENSYKALFLLSMEMDYVVGQQYNPIRTLDSTVSPFLKIPDNLKVELGKCKSIMINRMR
ncbi:hypothetical protein [Marinomonas lutimaris]|uniref:hypothetical protein n=1 Tax=Marinomonas lutimaris TaxID=2846746 RepID=UPI001CA5ACCD|nr:hypothetical protein [Marinomonas lutimaris]